MHLVVDIGNTETVLGLMDPENGELRAHWRLSTGTARTADEFDHLLHSLLARKGFDTAGVTRAVLGSVVPSVNDRMRVALEGLVSGPVFTVEPGADLPVRLDVDEPKTVGADRIVNTLAAKILYRAGYHRRRSRHGDDLRLHHGRRGVHGWGHRPWCAGRARVARPSGRQTPEGPVSASRHRDRAPDRGLHGERGVLFGGRRHRRNGGEDQERMEPARRSGGGDRVVTDNSWPSTAPPWRRWNPS